MPTKPLSNFKCTECGWTTLRWAGRCGECQSWGTVVSAAETTGLHGQVRAVNLEEGRIARPITEIETDAATHWATGITEFDRVLGGGLVPGVAILLSGEPGVGKSTLLLEVAARAAQEHLRVLYVSAEESVGQIKMRAERTGSLSPTLMLAAETDLATILGQIDAVMPHLVIVDSVQTVSSSTIEGSAGGPTQVRAVASALIRVAKERSLPVLLVGHVTKDGSIAGPRVLEHLVDVVCQFEGDRQTSLRFVRTLKNRFGPTDEVGCFEMTGEGIREVPDPSGLFLSRGSEAVSGTCVTVALEGRRALPVEVQALVVGTTAPNPRRVTNGVDSSRVSMLLAVLERRMKVRLSDKDVYVSTVGGVKLTEPAADLAIALAIASAASDLALPHNFVAFGEISLAGEVRPVTSSALRATEAKRLGFTNLVGPGETAIRAAFARAFNGARSGGPAGVESGGGRDRK
ncbi:DNA repair protein RadA [Subtercola vilae]|uniref:DNA repair protein RadA n=1 Tax=Subtercola vilae TaxID=2056433 RepID=A0A4T2C908_9MICO|nr:DNA repair protein RadA [Subtercola vilae]TIH40429.1 DNA repair protein RadA [Subtercola vilae]